MTVRKRWIAILPVLMLLVGCQSAAGTQIDEVDLIETSSTPSPSTVTAATTIAPTTIPTLMLSPTPAPTAIPRGGIGAADPADPLDGLRIADLAAREYGGSGIQLGVGYSVNDSFSQYRISYDSDGLTITGLANVPFGDGPFPVVILLHGYFTPDEYRQGFDTWRMGELLAERGYITLMPDYRNYAGSDSGPNPFRIGYVLDVMNLIAQVDAMPWTADGQIGVIGHSMGGEVAQWVAVLSDEVDAVVFYASMSGDVARNWEHARRYWPVQKGAIEAMAVTYGNPVENAELFTEVSPINYYGDIRMPVHIHHGVRDVAVPYWWSEEAFDLMLTAGVDVTFYPYAGERHGFTDRGFEYMMAQSVALFDEAVFGDVNQPDAGSQ